MPNLSQEIAALKAGSKTARAMDAHARLALIETMWTGIIALKDDLFAASRDERGTQDVDFAAELVMLKGEIDYVKKNLSRWMRPEKVKNSLATM